MCGGTWTEIGLGTTMSTSTKDDTAAADKGPKTVLTLYCFRGATPILFALPNLEKMSGADINPIVSQLFG